MRLRGVAGVATLTDLLSRRHLLAGCYPNGARPQMSQDDECPRVPHRDDHVVAGDGRCSLAQSRGLSQRVWHKGQLRPPGHMIDLAVVSVDHDAVGGCQDRSAVSEETLHWFGRNKGTPITAGRSATAMVDTDEVDGIPPTQQVRSVTGNPPGRTVSRQPTALEG